MPTVTNVRNGVMQIVDRGPYDRGRIIDVSRACGCFIFVRWALVVCRTNEEKSVEEADYCIRLVSISCICAKCSCD